MASSSTAVTYLQLAGELDSRFSGVILGGDRRRHRIHKMLCDSKKCRKVPGPLGVAKHAVLCTNLPEHAFASHDPRHDSMLEVFNDEGGGHLPYTCHPVKCICKATRRARNVSRCRIRRQPRRR